MNISNKLAVAKNFVTSKAGRQILKGQKHSPTVLFGAGVVGVVATTVLASKATLRFQEVNSEYNHHLEIAKEMYNGDEGRELVDYTKKDYGRDIVVIRTRQAQALTKLYAPALLCGTLSIAALTSSHVILNRRNAGLMAAYAALDKGFAEYRERVLNEVGEEREREIRYPTIEERIDDTEKGIVTTQKVVDPNQVSMYARFFDEYSTSWSRQPQYNLIFLRCQQNYANDLLRARGHLFLNEVYDLLGIERTPAAAVVGWVISKDGDNFVDFGIFDGDNPKARDFVNGRESSILLDFNVDGVIYDKI